MKTFALAGNPNCGKTTLFNKLTNSQEYVGNWNGVTIEKKQGLLKNSSFNIIDLPGIYSLSSYSEDETITRNYLLYEKPDLIINIIDATNIERNLYLTTQLIETGIPMIIVLNMMDEAEKHGDNINYKMMSEILHIPIIPISAAKSIGIENLIDALKNPDTEQKTESVLKNTDEFFFAQKIIEQLTKNNIECSVLMAMKIIEGDSKFPCDIPVGILHMIDIPQKSWDISIATDRYNFIDELAEKCIKKSRTLGELTISNKIDKILVNKYLAIPIFLAVMLLIFQITFSFGGKFLSDSIEKFIYGGLTLSLKKFLLKVNVSTILIDLITKGIIPGIGMILTFLPQISILFFFLSFIEDSGYIARAAFIMDKPLRKIGLSGKSFVPILLGFGCSVPAIMSTRTLDNPKDKQLTIILTPFISCSAKMPVYAILAGIFFPYNASIIIFSIYLFGIIVAALAGIILNKTVLRGEAANFVIELPPYRIPVFKNLIRHVYKQVKDFIDKAGTILLLASVAIWFMQNFDFVLHAVSNNSQSILGTIGKSIAPVFVPLGFGDWRSCVALITGFIAKETILSSLSILYLDLPHTLPLVFTPLSAYCYMIFASLYIPCMATVAVIRRETNSWRWTFFSVAFQFLTAWVVSFIIFQIGNLFL